MVGGGFAERECNHKRSVGKNDFKKPLKYGFMQWGPETKPQDPLPYGCGDYILLVVLFGNSLTVQPDGDLSTRAAHLHLLWQGTSIICWKTLSRRRCLLGLPLEFGHAGLVSRPLLVVVGQCWQWLPPLLKGMMIHKILGTWLNNTFESVQFVIYEKLLRLRPPSMFRCADCEESDVWRTHNTVWTALDNVFESHLCLNGVPALLRTLFRHISGQRTSYCSRNGVLIAVSGPLFQIRTPEAINEWIITSNSLLISLISLLTSPHAVNNSIFKFYCS